MNDKFDIFEDGVPIFLSNAIAMTLRLLFLILYAKASKL